MLGNNEHVSSNPIKFSKKVWSNSNLTFVTKMQKKSKSFSLLRQQKAFLEFASASQLLYNSVMYTSEWINSHFEEIRFGQK